MTFTNRITVVDVRVAFEQYSKIITGMHITGKIELQVGSSTYGRAYRITVDGSDAPGTGDRGFIGLTARDAYDTLWTIIRTLEFAKQMGL